MTSLAFTNYRQTNKQTSKQTLLKTIPPSRRYARRVVTGVFVGLRMLIVQSETTSRNFVKPEVPNNLDTEDKCDVFFLTQAVIREFLNGSIF